MSVLTDKFQIMKAMQESLEIDFEVQTGSTTIQNWSDVLDFQLIGAWQQTFGQKIHGYMKSEIKKPIRVLSLFSGVGGLDIGFHEVGFTIVEMVEIEKQFYDTLQKNSEIGKLFSGSNPVNIDICDYEPKKLGKIDFIIGGPPCQTFSAAGRR